jgi:hypothetical protein
LGSVFARQRLRVAIATEVVVKAVIALGKPIEAPAD